MKHTPIHRVHMRDCKLQTVDEFYRRVDRWERASVWIVCMLCLGFGAAALVHWWLS